MLRLFLLLLPVGLLAQTDYPDGVYLSHASLLERQPEVAWRDIAGEMVQLPNDFRLQIEGFGYKGDTLAGEPYAVCLDGLPYLLVNRNTRPREYLEFAALRILGTYSTFQYDTIYRTRQLMRAYNPANGMAFREGWVERDRRERRHRILDMASGQWLTMDRPTVVRLVSGDSQIGQALQRTGAGETEKLLRAIKIYNDRHPLPLP